MIKVMVRLELTASGFGNQRSQFPLSYITATEWLGLASNQRPPAFQTGAATELSYPTARNVRGETRTPGLRVRSAAL